MKLDEEKRNGAKKKGRKKIRQVPEKKILFTSQKLFENLEYFKEKNILETTCFPILCPSFFFNFDFDCFTLQVEITKVKLNTGDEKFDNEFYFLSTIISARYILCKVNRNLDSDPGYTRAIRSLVICIIPIVVYANV